MTVSTVLFYTYERLRLIHRDENLSNIIPVPSHNADELKAYRAAVRPGNDTRRKEAVILMPPRANLIDWEFLIHKDKQWAREYFMAVSHSIHMPVTATKAKDRAIGNTLRETFFDAQASPKVLPTTSSLLSGSYS